MPRERDQKSLRFTPDVRSRLILWQLLCLAVLLFAALSSVAQDGRPVTPPSSSQAVPAAKDNANPSAATSTADSERKKQIADESSKLLSMALALKAEVDKTTKDTLSMNVIRKADEIEKLARTVKEKVKQGPS